MIRIQRRRHWLTVLPLGAVLILSACGGGQASPSAAASEAGQPSPSEAAQPSQGGGAATADEVRAAILSDEATLNPYTYVTGFPGWNLLMLQYDSIMQIDTDGVPQPWLAESVEASDDGTVYTVSLAEGITWQDGETLDAQDVVFTVGYYQEYTGVSRFTSALAGVESVEAPDDLTVVFTLSAPNPAFPLSALADVPILPEHIWSEVTTPDEYVFEEGNVGSGPYRLAEYVPNQSYTFEANPDYFRGAPAVERLVLVQFADDAGALAAMNTGEVDVIFRPVAPEQIELLDAQEGIEILQGPEYTNQLFYYDMEQAPFDDRVVRQAISMAIDRQDLVDTVFLGAATVGNAGWIHPDSPVYNDAVETPYDVAGAQQMLEEAGYVDSDGDGIREFDGQPMSFEFLTRSEDALRLRTSELLAEMLTEIGIELKVVAVDLETSQNAVWPEFDVTKGRNYRTAMWGWSAPVQANPARAASLVHSDPAIGNINLTGYSSSEMDALVDELSTTVDPDARQELFDEFQALFAEDLPFITLLYPNGAYAYDSTVYGGWAFISGQGIVSKLSLLTPEARP